MRYIAYINYTHTHIYIIYTHSINLFIKIQRKSITVYVGLLDKKTFTGKFEFLRSDAEY